MKIKVNGEEKTIEEILIAGVRIIQHRFKTGTDQDHLQEAIQIKNLCKRYKYPLVCDWRCHHK